jgi:type VI secretion system protein ImpG
MAAEGDPTLLDLYAQELAYLREQGADFAAAYPKIAARLGVSGRQCADPHVERLLEGFAFLTARLQLQLEQDLPELTTGLLGVLYPQYTSPIPSMAIGAFHVDPKQAPTSGHMVEKGTPLFAEAQGGTTCWFRTCYPVTLWPIAIEGAEFVAWDDLRLSDAAIPPSEDGRVQRPIGAVRLRLMSEAPLRALGVTRLRFFVSGEAIESARIYDMLFERERPVLVTSGVGDRLPSRGRITPVGFGPDEDVLVYPPHAHPGHRLVQEYFHFPRKFMFFDLELGPLPESMRCDVLILLDRRPGNVTIRRGTFQLGCTPLINLFSRPTEPIRVDQQRAEYRLVADARRERFTEIHSILEVTATGPSEPEQKSYAPFFSFSHPAHVDDGEPRAFFHARRTSTGRADLPGADVYLSFVNLDFKPQKPWSEVVYARALCTNRDLAEEIDAGVRLSLEQSIPMARVECLTKPTPQIPAPVGGQTLWRLISNLSVNHLSLCEASGEALREVLRAYLFASTPEGEKQIAAITGVASRTVQRRVGERARRALCRGTEVTIELDEDLLRDSSPILFGEVLSRFLSLYAHLNSFTELVLRSTIREEVWKRWSPMVGAKPLL